MTIKYTPLEFFVQKILAHEPFSFSRYGDGEFNAIFGYDGENCDGHKYFRELGVDLAESLRHKYSGNFYYARGTKGEVEHGVKIIEWLIANDLGSLEWHNVDVFLEASLYGKLRPLVDALRTRAIEYVGPEHLLRLSRRFWYKGYIQVPYHNCYLQKRTIIDNLRLTLRKGKIDLVGLSAGMTSNVIIDELYPEFGDRVTFIDFGSLFDIYCGVKSRSYARNNRFNFDQLAKANFGEPGEYVGPYREHEFRSPIPPLRSLSKRQY